MKERWEDDGRTIADMSGVSRPALLRPGRPESRTESQQSTGGRTDLPKEEMTGRERFSSIMGVLTASLLIAGAFMVGIAIVILVLLRAWT